MNGREFDFPDSFEAATFKALAGPDVEMRGIQFDPAYTSFFEEIVDQSLKRFLEAREDLSMVFLKIWHVR